LCCRRGFGKWPFPQGFRVKICIHHLLSHACYLSAPPSYFPGSPKMSDEMYSHAVNCACSAGSLVSCPYHKYYQI
jgi:hypothetical protein